MPNDEVIKSKESNAGRIMFMNKLKTYNDMYKTSVDADKFISEVSEAWGLLDSEDNKTVVAGKRKLSKIFKETLGQAIKIEKDVSYEEQRLPEYTDIIKSTNELLRVSMFSFTDLYTNNKKANLFDVTSFGGMTSNELADLTEGASKWRVDQRSDEAWKEQSKAAKNIAEKWQQEDNPYQKMIDDLNQMVELAKSGIGNVKDACNKLAAAEWLLMNNEKMMIENPEDPINPVPNWENRYWKTIVQTREALGVPKHISMRELIQGNYAEIRKTTVNYLYNEKQIREQLIEPEQRRLHDSMDKQKEEFTVQRAGIIANQPSNEKKAEAIEMTSFRMKFEVEECDERRIMKEMPKIMNFSPSKTTDLEIKGQKNDAIVAQN